MIPNRETIDLIASFEGDELTSYLDKVASPPVWTISRGLTTGAYPGLKVVAGMQITQQQSDEMFLECLEYFGTQIRPMMTRAPTQSQFGAMLSLVWNIGVGSFSRSTCLKRFNAGDIEGAAEALQWFNKAGGKVLRGLVRRREAEAKLMLSDIDDRPIELVTARPDAEKTASKSTTIQATVATGVAGATGVGTAIGSLDGDAQMVVVIAACIAAIGLVWIFRERLKKLGGGV